MTRRWYALAVLVVAAAAIAPLALVNQPVTRHFRVGQPFLSQADVEIGSHHRFGPFPVQQKRYYQIELEATGTAAFQVYLDYQDGAGVKKYDPALGFDGQTQILYPITRAVRDDNAASVVIEVAAAAETPSLHVHRLVVCEISKNYYVWRAVVRTGSFVALILGLAFLGWGYYYRRSAAGPIPGGDKKAARRTAAYAATLLTLACSFGVFFLQSQHTRLFRQPLRPSITGWDGSFYYFWLRSAMVEGDFDFTKDLRYCNTMSLPVREEAVRDTGRTKIGLFPNKYPIGWALLEVPWYVAADGIARLVNARRDGWQPLYQVFLIAGQIVYALAGLSLAYRIVAGVLPPTLAVCGVVLGWMCSPLAYYQIMDLAMSHNVMFFALMVAYYSAGKLRDDPARLRHWVAVGLGCAFVILSRYQGAVMLLFPGVVCLQAVWRDRRCWRGMACGIAASLVPLGLQALAWKAVYGSYLLYTYEGEGFNWAHPHLYDVLFSPYHGLFNWHPALLVGFLGFAAWAVTTPRRTEALCFAASLLLMIYVNGSWWCWWFGDSFGSRAFEGCTLYAMLGFGWLLNVLAQRGVGFAATATAVLLAGLWNMNLLWLSSDGPLVLSKPIPWAEKIALTRRYWSTVF